MFARGTKTWVTHPLPARAVALEVSMFNLGLCIVWAASLELAHRTGHADREIKELYQHSHATVVVDVDVPAAAKRSRVYG